MKRVLYIALSAVVITAGAWMIGKVIYLCAWLYIAIDRLL